MGGKDRREQDTGTPEAVAVTAAGRVYEASEASGAPVHKISLKNINRHADIGSIKKLLRKEGIEFSRIRKRANNDHAFVTFQHEEDKTKAAQILDGYKFKGRYLRVEVAKALEDPFIAAQNQRRQRASSDGHPQKRHKGPSAHEARANDSSEGGEGQNPRHQQEDVASPADLSQSGDPCEQVADKVCPLWRKPYAEQLTIKRTLVENTMRNIARGIAKTFPRKEFADDEEKTQASWLKEAMASNKGLPCAFIPMIPSPTVDGYRTKCEFTISTGPNHEANTIGFRVGAYQDGSISVVPPTLCKNISEPTKMLVEHITDFVRSSGFPHYDKVTHKGVWRQLLVRNTRKGENLIVLYLCDQSLSKEDVATLSTALHDFLVERSLPVTVAQLQIDNSLSCKDPHRDAAILVKGESEYITETLLGLDFRISADAFFQVNTEGAETLYTLIGDWCQLSGTKNETLLDVCCGTGTIGQSLASKVDEVIGIEMVEEAVEDARANAKRNGIDNVVYFADKAENVMSSIAQDLAKKHVVAVVDPPRAGLHHKVVRTLRTCKEVNRLVYVSCSLKGASQNIIDLCKPRSKRWRGEPFTLVRAATVDMFPHTDHCEVVMFLARGDDIVREFNAKHPLPVPCASESVPSQQEGAVEGGKSRGKAQPATTQEERKEAEDEKSRSFCSLM